MVDAAVVDLFCGAGGLAYGLADAGLSVKAGIDLDPACRYPFEANVGAPFIESDVSTVDPNFINELFGSSAVRVLAGCAPCQPFSGYSSTRRSADDRWRLLLSFLSLVKVVRPEVCTIENVPRLAKLDLWKQVVSGLVEAGYHVDWNELDCSAYGVPQSRRRLVLIASRLGPIALPKPTVSEPVSVRSAIGKLPPLSAGSSDELDPLHASRALTADNLARVRASRPGGTWREWPDEIRAACHRKQTGRTYGSVYGRMSWDKPSPTITTQFYGFGNGRFGHPDQDRALTIREAAILQSFPPEFRFLKDREKINFRLLGKLIGNAVPPNLGKAIGQTILDHVGGIGDIGGRKTR